METGRENISGLIKNEAVRLGFSACGISRARFLEEEAANYEQWLRLGYHGEMHYMKNNIYQRLNPDLLMPGAKSVISVLFNYYTDKSQADRDAPIISKYAYGRDYHSVIKKKLEELLAYIQVVAGDVPGKAFVDSAPLPEKAWAKISGLGWTGKNSLLISETGGSFFFIGELLVNIDLDYDKSVLNQCGSCMLCMEACPTGAIVSPAVVDVRRCISYSTIEMKRNLPSEILPLLNNRIFGCDICQDICPWNRNAVPHSSPELKPKPEFLQMSKKDWYEITEVTFLRVFGDTPVKRAGYKKFKDILSKMSSLNRNLHETGAT